MANQMAPRVGAKEQIDFAAAAPNYPNFAGPFWLLLAFP